MFLINLARTAKSAYDMLPQHTGAWGTKDLGITEGITDRAGLARNAQGGSQGLTTYDPYLPNDFIGPTKPFNITTKNNYGSDLPMPTGSDGSGGGSGYSAPTNNNNAPSGPSEFELAVNRARAAYESAMRDADYQFNRARGIYDEGMGLLGKRREQFQELFNQGNMDITNEYQGRGGELGASAQNRRMSDAAALQAQGFGGSAVERAQNRQSRDEMRALGGLQESRNENKVANQAQFDERDLWARGQESALSRSLDDAANARRSVGERAGLVMQGDVEGINSSAAQLLNQIVANQQAMQAAQQGISGFTANPYNVNIADLTSSIRNQLSGTPTGAGAVQNVSLQEQNPLLLGMNPKKRGGVAGAGLYA